MRVLCLTNMFPGVEQPRDGTFVKEQVVGLRSVGVEVEVLHLNRATSGMLVYLNTRAEVRKAVHRFHPDLIHVMYGSVMAFLAQFGAGTIPLVVSFCGTDLLGDELGAWPVRVRAAVGKWCSHNVARSAAQIIVKSQSLLRALPPAVDRSKVSIIPNGVNPEMFRPLDRNDCRSLLGWDASVFNVLFVTGKMGGANKRLSLSEAAVQCLKRDGIAAKLQVMTHTPHDDVPIWLNAADVLLLTSHHEGSPNIIKEALACNRPVVSVDVGDVREQIEGIEGCHIAEPDPGNLARKLAMVAKGPRVVQAREKMKDLSLEAVARRLVKVYEAAVEAGAAG